MTPEEIVREQIKLEIELFGHPLLASETLWQGLAHHLGNRWWKWNNLSDEEVVKKARANFDLLKGVK